MLRPRRFGERGQTLPMWVLGAVACLMLLFFVVNFGNQITWTIRAQSAADVAGIGGMLPDADINNQISMQEYALALNDARLRYLNQALLNVYAAYQANGGLVNGRSVCTSRSACATDYAALYSEMQTAAGYSDPSGMKMQVADGLTKGGLQEAERDGFSAGQNGCSNSPPAGDCTSGKPTFDVYLNAATTDQNTGYSIYDVYACRQVTTLLPKMFHVGSTFRAIGRSVIGLRPQPETVTVGNMVDPDTGTRYVPNESYAPDKAYTTVDFSQLQATVMFFGAGPVQGTSSFNPQGAPC